MNVYRLGTGGTGMPLVMLAIGEDNRGDSSYPLVRSFGRVAGAYRGIQKQDDPLLNILCKFP